jgi:hypothetical protein
MASKTLAEIGRSYNVSGATISNAVHLRCVDPARKMRRFTINGEM